ncbi:MAG TPA: hypothetical protein VGA02_03600 [Gemmatimonadales bacterium]|jgi:hypothetical protein
MTAGMCTNRRGFALPAVILLVALLTVLLTSGLTRARVEHQLAEASDETAAALAIAQSGLQTYFGTVVTLPADGDSTRINVTGGFANVITHLVRRPADTTQRILYLVRSTGIVINPGVGPTPQAQRTVAQFAEWEYGYILRRGVLTAANGQRHLNNNSDPARLEVNGNDQCGVDAPIPGIRTPDLAWAGPADPDTSIVGAPGIIVAGTGPTTAAETLIDWAGALGGSLTPDYSSFQNGSTAYSIQRIAGALTLSGTNSGTGLLVVGDSLVVRGASFTFDGIVLVGGRILFEADYQRINGLVVTGLNEQLGVDPARTHTGGAPPQNRRDVYLYYDACKVDSALAAVSGLAPVRNAWLDTWATY